MAVKVTAQPVVMLEYFANGERDYCPEDVTSKNIYSHIKSVLASMKLEEDREGTKRFPKLKARDLLKFVTAQSETTFTIRQHVIILRMDPFSAIIFKDRCLLLVPEGADNVLSDFLDRIERVEPSGGFGNEEELGFEFKALEALLSAVVNSHEKTINKIGQEVTFVIDRVQKAFRQSDLEQLRVLKNEIAFVSAAVSGVQQSLRDLIDDDEDLCLAHLTKFSESPELFADAETFEHEDMETLMESYLQDCNRLETMLTQYTQRIQSIESLTVLRSAAKTRLAFQTDVTCSLIGICLTIIIDVAGLCGMNLTKGPLEQDHRWFVGIVVTTCMTAFVVFILTMAFYYYKGMFI